MAIIYKIVRFFPFWALPLCLVLFDLGVFYRRKHSPAQRFFWFMVVLLVLLSLLWFVFRGDLNSEKWVKGWLKAVES
jgi:hypothetical protein